jgi:chaperonin cofactor prefoldin
MNEEACDGCRELEEKVELLEERLFLAEERIEKLNEKINALTLEVRTPKSNAVKSSSNIYSKNPHKRQ